MATREELVEQLASAIEGRNSDDIADASAALARFETRSEIDSLKQVLRLVADTLPHIGGNERSVDALMRQIRHHISE